MKTMRQERQRGTRGFAMVEVLIAILVISFGLLGLAGIQAVSLKANQTAYYRSIATQQTYDMADRMRANLAGVATNAYDAIGSGVGTDPGCITAGCSAANLALNDRYAWNTANAALLPGGDGTVRGSTATTFVITVSWTEKCSSGESGCATDGTRARSFATRFQPCVNKGSAICL